MTFKFRKFFLTALRERCLTKLTGEKRSILKHAPLENWLKTGKFEGLQKSAVCVEKGMA